MTTDGVRSLVVPVPRPVFVTARFRSGSTVVWHLLRQLADVVAYYEPCHPNLLSHVASDTPPQESHVGVASYWAEYRARLAELAALHEGDFGLDRLLLEPTDRHPRLERYLTALIEAAAPSTAVLQFNRADFRLPWLRARFPNATIVHLYRDPREEWLSTMQEVPRSWWEDPGYPNAYEDTVWSAALAAQLPVLVGDHICHPYERHYLLWRLSFEMARRHADLSVSLEDDLQRRPVRTFQAIVRQGRLAVDAGRISALARQVVRRRRRRAPSYRDAAWFARVERRCARLLRDVGLLPAFGVEPLARIRTQHRAAWRPFEQRVSAAAVRLAVRAVGELRGDQIVVGGWLRRAGLRLDELTRKNAQLRHRLARLERSSARPPRAA